MNGDLFEILICDTCYKIEKVLEYMSIPKSEKKKMTVLKIQEEAKNMKNLINSQRRVRVLFRTGRWNTSSKRERLIQKLKFPWV